MGYAMFSPDSRRISRQPPTIQLSRRLVLGGLPQRVQSASRGLLILFKLTDCKNRVQNKKFIIA